MPQTSNQNLHECKRHTFGITIIVLEVFITIIYGLFLRVQHQNNPKQNFIYYPMYQDVNTMMLIGFGFLMTFIKNNAWTALAYTFFINSIAVQLYVILFNFWKKVFHGEWDHTKIYVQESSFTLSSYASAAILISFGCVIGKVGPLQLLVMGLVCLVGYTLNQQLVYQVLKTFDAGGSMAIHTFGGFFGLAVGFVLSRISKPEKGAQTTYGNVIFGMIGTLFLWMFWPSFNAGYFASNEFQISLIVSNTIMALTGSCLITFALSSLMRNKLNMQDILNATLAGGVIIGAGSGVVANMGVSLAIGIIGGVISTIGYLKINHLIEKSWLGIHDTCGIASLHAIPGFLGGLISAIVLASYQIPPGYDQNYKDYLDLGMYGRTYGEQAGIQVAATFISMGMGIFFGLVAGLIIKTFYKEDKNDFFTDSIYFELPENNELLGTLPQKKFNYLDTSEKIIKSSMQ